MSTFNLSLFRILRLARVVKLVNVNPGLKTLLKSLIVSLSNLWAPVQGMLQQPQQRRTLSFPGLNGNGMPSPPLALLLKKAQ